VKINTIGFGDNKGEPLLKAIAEQNRGTYQFISAEQEELAEAAAGRSSQTPLGTRSASSPAGRSESGSAR
jgi:hypothetical protein